MPSERPGFGEASREPALSLSKATCCSSQGTTSPARSLRLHVTLGHPLHPRIRMRMEPRCAHRLVQQLSVTRRQVVALADEEHVQNAVAFLAQRKPHRIGMALGRKPAAGVRVAEIAARLQLFVTGPRALMTGSGARPRPSCAQGKPLRKRPVGLESLFWHEEGAGHKILVRRGGPARVQRHCTDSAKAPPPQCTEPDRI